MKFRPSFVLGLAAIFGASSLFAGDCGCNGGSAVVSSGASTVVSGSVVGGAEGGCGCTLNTTKLIRSPS